MLCIAYRFVINLMLWIANRFITNLAVQRGANSAEFCIVLPLPFCSQKLVILIFISFCFMLCEEGGTAANLLLFFVLTFHSLKFDYICMFSV